MGVTIHDHCEDIIERKVQSKLRLNIKSKRDFFFFFGEIRREKRKINTEQHFYR